VVGLGLLVAGLSAYGFVALSSRVLGEVRYGPLGALWALVFLAGPGLFLPVEQEVSRALAHRRARGLGGAPVVYRAAAVGIGLLLVVAAVLAATSPWSVDRVFDHQVLLLIGLVLGLAAALAAHLTRGCLSGTGNFKGYGTFIGADGFIRFLGCALLALIGVRTAGWYGVALGIAGLLAVPVALRVQRPRLDPGPESTWGEISTALGYLLMASLCAYGIMNIGPVLVQVLATSAEADLAGRFLPAVIVARIPLFLFQAIQAALLPKLSALASAGRLADFRNGLRRLLTVVAGLAVVGTIGGWLIGPLAVRIMSGPEFELGHRTLGLLAAGSGFYMLALAVAQAVIALGGHREQALGWASGMGVLLLVTWIASDDLYLRVELGLLAGSLAAFGVMAVFLARRLFAFGHPDVGIERTEPVDALAEVAVEA
jgi:O-antigen/teichoic acid export membrane protein